MFRTRYVGSGAAVKVAIRTSCGRIVRAEDHVKGNGIVECRVAVVDASPCPLGKDLAMKQRLGAVERLFPMPCVLVVGGTMEEADTLAVAWINVVSSTPPTIAMGLRKTRRTLELIRANGGTFTVNVPDTKLAAQVDYCGIVSGKSADKFAATGLTLVPASVVATPIIDECPYNIECRTTHEVEVGEYVVVFGEIVECHAEERILRDRHRHRRDGRARPAHLLRRRSRVPRPGPEAVRRVQDRQRVSSRRAR